MRDRAPRFQVKAKDDKHSINEQIRAPEVRVIGADGAQLGVLRTGEAIRIAAEAGLDLVEVAGTAKPPVCRILDYGKLKYREQKKAAETRKKSAIHVVKELRVRYSTDKHDLETKLRQAREFLTEGDKVKFSMRFSGREVVYESLGRKILEEIVEALKDISAVEEITPLMGRRMILNLVPRSQAHPSHPK